MKLYLKLALDGVRKNRRLYVPYILISSVMVMMHYILAALSVTPMLRQFRGGGILRELLPLGMGIVAIFAAIFLFYCSSFIIRQRNREFGLFSVLGMSRKNLSLLMLVENLLTAGASIVCGLLLCFRMDYTAPTFTLQGGKPLRVKEALPDDNAWGNSQMTIYPSLTLITPDFEGVTAHLAIDDNSYIAGLEIQFCWCYAFNVTGSAEDKLALYDPLMNHLRDLAFPRERGGYSYKLSLREMERVQFYGMYGGLFFIGIMLSIVFIAAAVLIIYYKQVSEGYEDQKRFAIMQKVGMTKWEIRRSINSQVLTVFFAPLLMAGLHLAFAFPLMWKLLMMLNFSNMPLMIAVTACCFAVFGVMYAVVYKVTSNAYFAIVSNQQNNS